MARSLCTLGPISLAPEGVELFTFVPIHVQQRPISTSRYTSNILPQVYTTRQGQGHYDYLLLGVRWVSWALTIADVSIYIRRGINTLFRLHSSMALRTLWVVWQGLLTLGPIYLSCL